jgi:hypothetical protein
MAVHEDDLKPLWPGSRRVKEPAITIMQDGRVVFNVGAIRALTGDGSPGFVKFYLQRSRDGSSKLVVVPSGPDDPQAVKVHRVGRVGKKHPWPSGAMVRARWLMMELGISERVRFSGVYDESRGWLVFDLTKPLDR